MDGKKRGGKGNNFFLIGAFSFENLKWNGDDSRGSSGLQESDSERPRDFSVAMAWTVSGACRRE